MRRTFCRWAAPWDDINQSRFLSPANYRGSRARKRHQRGDGAFMWWKTEALYACLQRSGSIPAYKQGDLLKRGWEDARCSTWGTQNVTSVARRPLLRLMAVAWGRTPCRQHRTHASSDVRKLLLVVRMEDGEYPPEGHFVLLNMHPTTPWKRLSFRTSN